MKATNKIQQYIQFLRSSNRIQLYNALVSIEHKLFYSGVGVLWPIQHSRSVIFFCHQVPFHKNSFLVFNIFSWRTHHKYYVICIRRKLVKSNCVHFPIITIIEKIISRQIFHSYKARISDLQFKKKTVQIYTPKSIHM